MAQLRTLVTCCLPSEPQPTASGSAAWYTQSRPQTQANRKHRRAQPWHDRQCEHGPEQDLLSLHENRSHDSNNRSSDSDSAANDDELAQARPRGRRRGTGDISGGGAVEGSGLSRWTLFVSWLSSRRNGTIRLLDDPIEGEDTFNSDGETIGGLGGGREGEEDAFVLGANDTLEPPREAPAYSIAKARPRYHAGNSYIDQQISEQDEEEDTEAKQIRRAWKRERKTRARELGLTAREFDQGHESVLGESGPSSNYSDTRLAPHPNGARRHRPSSRSSNGSTSTSNTDPSFILVDKKSKPSSSTAVNGSDGLDPRREQAELADDGAEALFGSISALGRDRDDARSEERRSSHRSKGSREDSSGGGSSRRAKKEMERLARDQLHSQDYQDFLQPSPGPDPGASPTPSSSSYYPSVSPALVPYSNPASLKPSHRSHKSNSHSISTTSSLGSKGRSGRRTKGSQSREEEDLFSNGSSNARGHRWSGMEQLQGMSIPPGSYLAEGEEEEDVGHAQGDEEDHYAHIGQLPGEA